MSKGKNSTKGKKPERITEIDFGITLQAMIAMSENDFVTSDITPECFPVEGHGIKRFRNEMFASVAAMRKKKFEPATHVHGFAFSTKFPHEQLRRLYACPGFSTEMNGPRMVYFAKEDFNATPKREVRLTSTDNIPASWRLLGVQEISSA